MDAEILYEDGAVLVCRKPAGLAVQTARIGQPDLVSRLKNHLAGGLGGKKQPYLGIVHRLDQPVEGLLVFAKTKEAAAALSGQLTDGILNKHYLAVVWGKPEPAEGGLVDWLTKNTADSRAEVVTHREPVPGDARKAVLSYRLLDTAKMPGRPSAGGGMAMGSDNGAEVLSLLDICIETGRFHQIRAQLAYGGHPIFADHKYSPEKELRQARALGGSRVALCACSLAFLHPASGKKMEYGIIPEGIPFSWFGEER